MIPSGDMWFIPYHTYFPVNSHRIGPYFGMKAFMEDLNYAHKNGIKYIVMEDYWYGPKWGDYSHFASETILIMCCRSVFACSSNFMSLFLSDIMCV